jgi:cobalt-zinc-cadmium efflux system outer membrane protein
LQQQRAGSDSMPRFWRLVRVARLAKPQEEERTLTRRVACTCSQLSRQRQHGDMRAEAAEAARSAARADLADARRRAASAVAHAHQDLWAAQGRRAQLEAAVSLSAESLRLLDQRVRAGDAPALDATRFRLDDARLQADLRQSVADSQDLQRQLALLIGAPGLAVQLQAQASDQPWVMPDGTGAIDVTHEGRADVVAAMARVSATASLRDLAVAARTRDLNIGLQFDHWPTGPGNNSGTGDTVSVSVSVPLFVRHANEGEVARAEADLAAAQEALRKVRDTAAIDWARAEGQARAAGDRRRLVVEQLEPAAEKVAAGAELAYRRGASTALELLDARRSLRAVRLERINADAELAKALVDWRVAAVPSDLSLNP